MKITFGWVSLHGLESMANVIHGSIKEKYNTVEYDDDDDGRWSACQTISSICSECENNLLHFVLHFL